MIHSNDVDDDLIILRYRQSGDRRRRTAAAGVTAVAMIFHAVHVTSFYIFYVNLFMVRFIYGFTSFNIITDFHAKKVKLSRFHQMT
ncbi:hypothetical protein [Paenibacillus pini]|uniref:hypothetical protein n=1 Tax=Paenibacillus pini TaxID=669461 RepID=UPI0013922A1F|nr:hypothetical protein [Paenibacillus pini]